MRGKAWLKKIKNAYVLRQAARAAFPAFAEELPCRYRIVFRGRVQKVGFRLELSELAKRLALTGWVKNLPDGDVLAELQGGESRIRFLVDFMRSLKRIRIKKMVWKKMVYVPSEEGFRII